MSHMTIGNPHMAACDTNIFTSDRSAVGALVKGITVPAIRSPLKHSLALTTLLGFNRTIRVV